MNDVKTAARILVAEDREWLREILLYRLRAEGFTADGCADGVEAAKQLGSSEYGLLITDLDMPRKNGMDLVRELRAEGCTMPVILMSGSITVDPGEVCAELGLVAFLQKPFPMEDLLVLVAGVLGVLFARKRGPGGAERLGRESSKGWASVPPAGRGPVPPVVRDN